MRCNFFNNMFIHIFIFVEFFKDNLCKTIYVDSIYPSNIKINNHQVEQDDQFFYITLIFNDSIVENIEDKKHKTLSIVNDKNPNEILQCIPIDKQDDENNKIEFKFDQRLFWNSTLNYGKYRLKNLDTDEISFDETMLIYLNNIGFKNPINKYEFTNQSSGKLTINYLLDNDIKLEYINRIMYTDSSTPNIEPKDFSDYEILNSPN